MTPPPDLVVDPLSLGDFQKTLQARLEEAYAALLRIEQSGAAPALGGFEDAHRTGTRHQLLRDQAKARLQRLIGALAAAQAATTAIATRYATVEALNTADISQALRPLAEELQRGHEGQQGHHQGQHGQDGQRHGG